MQHRQVTLSEYELKIVLAVINKETNNLKRHKFYKSAVALDSISNRLQFAIDSCSALPEQGGATLFDDDLPECMRG